MNNIEILEKLVERCKECEINNTQVRAIENLIQENKELKEMLKHRIKYTNELEKDLFENASNYVIPKSKVKAKIEELEKLYNLNDSLTSYEMFYFVHDYVLKLKNVLQELLKEGE